MRPKSKSLKHLVLNVSVQLHHENTTQSHTIAKIVQNQKGLRATFILPSLIHNDRFI